MKLLYLLEFVIITIFIVISIRLQVRRIREKLKKKLSQKNTFLQVPKSITIENKNTFFSKFIYLLNRFIYHLGSVILLVFFYKYVLFVVGLILKLFNKTKTSFFLKKDWKNFLDPITESFYLKSSHFFSGLPITGTFDMKTGEYISILSYPSDLNLLAIQVIYPVLLLTLIFLFFDFLLKKEFFTKEKQINLIDNKKLINVLSITFLVIIFQIFIFIFSFVGINLFSKKLYIHIFSRNLNLKDLKEFFTLSWYIILYFYWAIPEIIITRYPFCFPILATVFYCFSSRLRDLKFLIREINRKLKKV